MKNTIVDNIIHEIMDTKKQSFTKDEIIKLINDVTLGTQLPILESNGITLNPETFNVIINNAKTTIPKKEFNLLYYLINNKNKTMRRNDILRDIWGAEVIVLDRTLDVHIRKLRARLNLTNIRTSKGIGYMWIEN